jgi:hypothetical protein
VFPAGFKHVNIIVFKNNFCIYPAQTGAADAQGKIIVDVGTLRHDKEMV